MPELRPSLRDGPGTSRAPGRAPGPRRIPPGRRVLPAALLALLASAAPAAPPTTPTSPPLTLSRGVLLGEAPPPGPGPLLVLGGDLPTLTRAWPDWLAGAAMLEDGTTLPPGELGSRVMMALAKNPGWRALIWAARTPGRASLEGVAEVVPARVRLRVRLREEPAGVVDRQDRAFGVHLIPPGAAPVLLAWVRLEDAAGRSLARDQYVGAWAEPDPPHAAWHELQPDRAVVRGPDRPIPSEALRRFGAPRAPDAAPLAPGEPLPYEVLSRGDHARTVGKAARRAVAGAAEFRREWLRLHEEVRPIPPVPALPTGRDLVVALYLGARTTAGWKAEVSGAWLREDGAVEVWTREVPPGEGEDLAVETFPYALVRIDAPAGRRVVFRPAGGKPPELK